MQEHHSHAVKVLNSLIETTLDSANGYKEAAENVTNPEYRTLFSDRSRARLDLTRRLQAEVRTFGGQPEEDGSVLGALHNKFVDVKTALLGGADDKAVITEVERGEDFIKAKYEMALKDEELPAEARVAITQACEEVRRDHDQMSALKHSLQ
jgi:uncharacterized protein (TIGR02284 family)